MRLYYVLININPNALLKYRQQRPAERIESIIIYSRVSSFRSAHCTTLSLSQYGTQNTLSTPWRWALSLGLLAARFLLAPNKSSSVPICRLVRGIALSKSLQGSYLLSLSQSCRKSRQHCIRHRYVRHAAQCAPLSRSVSTMGESRSRDDGVQQTIYLFKKSVQYLMFMHKRTCTFA